jgi:hypothetical protein
MPGGQSRGRRGVGKLRVSKKAPQIEVLNADCCEVLLPLEMSESLVFVPTVHSLS